MVPARIVDIGSNGTLVYGRVRFDQNSDPRHLGGDPEDASGYFLLDTDTDETRLRMQKEEWSDALAVEGLSRNPSLVPPHRFSWSLDQ